MLDPRHILLTGASSGIGAALAALYAAPGVRLSLHGRDAERLDRVAESARQRGATAIAKTGDVAYAEAMAAWIDQCDRLQPIDLVIANAGISAGTGRQGESDVQARAIFAVNLTGVLNTVQPAVPHMAQRGRGQIAIVSSLAGFRGFAGAPAYCASKAAVRVYGEALRGELAAQGVAVNVVCPGFIKTPMTDTNHFPMPFIMPAERAAQIIRKGLARNRARIAFPWTMYALARLVAALPQDWIARPISRLPKKRKLKLSSPSYMKRLKKPSLHKPLPPSITTPLEDLGSTNMPVERTLSIIKPDATRRNLTGKINAKFEEDGLRIIAQKRVRLTRAQVEGFYAVHKDRPFFKDLCAFMITGPVVVQVLEGDNAVARNREIMGATDPAKAAPGTIRALFAESIEANSVHGSDSAENAKQEIAFFFKDNEIVG